MKVDMKLKLQLATMSLRQSAHHIFWAATYLRLRAP